MSIPRLLFMIGLTIASGGGALAQERGVDQATAMIDRSALEAFAAEHVAEHGGDVDEILRVLEGATVRAGVLERIARPAERILGWADYRRIFLDEPRIENGARFLAEHADLLARAEAEHGVAPAHLVALLGVETRYGEIQGDWPVLDALYTLTFAYPPRSAFFRGQLSEFLRLAREEGQPADAFLGSYAGAMGYGQFIPSSYRHYAVDFDGDGDRDIWNDVQDAVGSVANYLARNGWARGGEVLRWVRVDDPQRSAELLSEGLPLERTVGELRAAGVLDLEDLPADEPAGYWRLQVDGGERHAVTFGNFRTITRYNHSHLYAFAVDTLAREIRAAATAQEDAAASGSDR